jgi:hypothetical protein
MGYHYVPQFYLKGFCRNFGRTIWVYDKQEIRKFPTQVKSVANICGLYPQELEKYLSEEIEAPTNQVLKKIRNREHLTPTEKVTLSRYIAVLWKRVPEGMSRLKERAPRVAADLRESLHRRLADAVWKDPLKETFARRRKAEIDEILERYSQDPPEDIWHQIIPADCTPRIIEAIATMTWRFYTFDEKPAFLTGDNPVFFFSHLGIGKAQSELTFPISSHVMLWATRRLDLAEGYFPATLAIVKEMSRRIASVTTRYIFHALNEDWILPFLAKKRWQLNLIQ